MTSRAMSSSMMAPLNMDDADEDLPPGLLTGTGRCRHLTDPSQLFTVKLFVSHSFRKRNYMKKNMIFQTEKEMYIYSKEVLHSYLILKWK